MKSNYSLFIAIKKQISKDNTRQREKLFNIVLDKNIFIRTLYKYISKSNFMCFLTCFFYSLFSFGSFTLSKSNDSEVGIYLNPNSKNVLHKFSKLQKKSINHYKDSIFERFLFLFTHIHIPLNLSILKKVYIIHRNLHSIPLYVRMRAILVIYDYLYFLKIVKLKLS